MDTTTPQESDPSPFSVFRRLAAKLMQVPKAEAEAQEAEYQKQQEGKPKRGPKPTKKLAE